MTVILGIDAAWTNAEPSGMALVATHGAGWKCLAAAPSYDSFLAWNSVEPDWTQPRFRGSLPNVPKLLETGERLAGAPVDLVTVDMPVSTVTFKTRRPADDAISREFGSRGCSAHTPNEQRPGPVGTCLSLAFAEAGFPIATAATQGSPLHHLLEVYPHPALLALLSCEYRVQYKIAKARRYWPLKARAERIASLLANFQKIHAALTAVFGPLGLPLPTSVDRLSYLKRYEDTLDALICAWVGVCYIAGEAVALGNEEAAIWCPKGAVKSKG